MILLPYDSDLYPLKMSFFRFIYFDLRMMANKFVRETIFHEFLRDKMLYLTVILFLFALNCVKSVDHAVITPIYNNVFIFINICCSLPLLSNKTNI
jgi:hypothetical protein